MCHLSKVTKRISWVCTVKISVVRNWRFTLGILSTQTTLLSSLYV